MLHVPGMPEGVHVSFSPEHLPVLSTAQPDPVFALIKAHRVAYAAWEPLAAVWNDAIAGTPEYDAAEAAQAEPCDHEQAAFRALLEVRPATAAGLWALTAYLPEATRKASPDAQTDEQAALDVLREGALRLGLAAVQAEAKAVRSTHFDPHVALVPSLRQAFAWTRDAQAFNDDPQSSPEGRANTAVLKHCWNLADRIVALPAPVTLAGMGALALALCVWSEGSIGLPQNDGLDHERYPEERRVAASVRAMMSVSGVTPLAEWTGFGDEPDSQARWDAMMERIGEGSLPAWALDGKSGPDDEEIATGEEVTPAVAPKVIGSETPNLDLSGYSVPHLCALFDVYDRAEDQFYTAAWWPKLDEAGSELVTTEGDRCMALKNAVADELQKRQPGSESDADERAEKLMRRAVMTGDWESIARLACSLRNEVAACQGTH